MTQLLISVTSIEEARIALENGADFIDLKDPGQGALGALPIDKVREITDFVHTQNQYSARLVSATIGDLPMQPALICERVASLADTGVDIIKIGFFEVPDYQPCLDVLKPLAQQGLKLIAVLFAEHKYSGDLIAAIKQAGFYGLMIDTVHKNGCTFMDYVSEDEMKAFAQQVQMNGLILGLAGSLNIQHIAMVKRFNPSYIGFRGGVSLNNQRKLHLDAAKIKAISEMV